MNQETSPIQTSKRIETTRGQLVEGWDFLPASTCIISEILCFKFGLSVSWEGKDLKPACDNQLHVCMKYSIHEDRLGTSPSNKHIQGQKSRKGLEEGALH